MNIEPGLYDFDFYGNYVELSEFFTEEKARLFLEMEIELWKQRNPERTIHEIQWIKRDASDLGDHCSWKAHVSYKFCSLKVKGK